jgi:hypothetical protein
MAATAQEGGCSSMSATTGTGPADAEGATAPTNATGGADAKGPVDATGPTDPEAHGGPAMSALAEDADGGRPDAMANDQISAQAKDALSNAREVADGGVAYVKAKYRENPVLVIAVGAAALIAVTTVLKAIFRR